MTERADRSERASSGGILYFSILVCEALGHLPCFDALGWGLGLRVANVGVDKMLPSGSARRRSMSGLARQVSYASGLRFKV